MKPKARVKTSQRKIQCSAKRPMETSDDADEGAIETVEAPSSELEDEGEAGDAEEAAETRPSQPEAPERRGPDYKQLTPPASTK